MTVYNSIEGKGLKLNTAADVEQICNDIKALEGLTEIRLSGNTFGVEAAQAIAKALATQEKLSVIQVNVDHWIQ